MKNINFDDNWKNSRLPDLMSWYHFIGFYQMYPDLAQIPDLALVAKLIINKNALQLKAHLPLADRKSNTSNLTLYWPWPWYDLDLRQVKLSLTDVQVAKLPFSMRWPWPWSNDLDTQNWPRYGQDVPPYQKWSLFQLVQKLQPEQTHTDTDTQTTLPLPLTREVKKSLKYTLTQ